MIRHIFLLIFAVLVVLPRSTRADDPLPPDNFRVTFPEFVVQHVPAEISIRLGDGQEGITQDSLKTIAYINGEKKELVFFRQKAVLSQTFDAKGVYSIRIGGNQFEKEVDPIPLWLSILPPLIAILAALLFREVYSALFIGLFVGASIISYYKGFSIFMALFKGFFLLIDTYVVQSLLDEGHMSIIIFSMMIGAMVHLVTRNGGMKGVVNILSRYARSDRSGQFITWLMGVLIFFDDYANTLVVGNTMRPVTDRLRISRQKLAYIVDSTAAPVAAIAFVTTWIGAELSYIQDGVTTIGIDESAYTIFFNSLAYSFYPLFTLSFMLILLFRRVDFGPMLIREREARRDGVESVRGTLALSGLKMEDLEEEKAGKERWYNAVIPVAVIVFGTFAGLFYTGWDQQVWDDPSLGFMTRLSHIIGNSNSYKALLWSSLSGTLVAVIMSLSQRLLTLRQSVESLMNGLKTMLTAVMILVLAWAIALVTKHMHTADFISRSMMQMSLSPYLVPAITFILAALVSFSTGSSWGTMAILYPLLLPAIWLLSHQSGFDYEANLSIFHNVVSAVLAGSVLGDHCSPISDTTILSSLASSCDHIEHVRTQLPYAVTVGSVSIFAGTIPAAYGVPFYVTLPAGIIMMYLIIRFFGKKTVEMAVNKQSLNKT